MCGQQHIEVCGSHAGSRPEDSGQGPFVARGSFLVTPEFLNVISRRHFFIPSMVDYLLETVPMVVPFKDNENNLDLSDVVYLVTMNLTSILLNILESRKGLGGYYSSWTAFQFELALEEIVFGRLLSPSPRQYAAALGVCACNPNRGGASLGWHLSAMPVWESSHLLLQEWNAFSRCPIVWMEVTRWLGRSWPESCCVTSLKAMTGSPWNIWKGQSSRLEIWSIVVPCQSLHVSCVSVREKPYSL